MEGLAIPPRAPADGAAPALPEPESPLASGERRAAEGCVLIVEDDAAIRRVVALALADEGYGVAVASNGRVALERLRYHRPRLILLDLQMPEVNGWEFARRYRARPGPHASIVVVAAAVDVAAQAAPIGAAAVLAKPFDLDALLAVVARYAGPPR